MSSDVSGWDVHTITLYLYRYYFNTAYIALISGYEHNIPDSSLTASSTWQGGGYHDTRCSRMVMEKPDGCFTFGWAKDASDINPWMQVCAINSSF